MPQLMKSGNMFDKGKLIYGALPEKYRPRFLKGDKKVAIFPHGPELEYSYLKHDNDLDNFQGAEMTGFFIDEATQFQWEHIAYLFSRMRSNSKYASRMVMSSNPDPDHKCRQLVDFWLDDEGYPHPDKEGIIRYFLIINDEFVWADTKEELINEHRTAFYEPKPLSFSAIFSNIYSNPAAIAANPGYVSFLEGLNKIEKARLLYGNWDIREEAANYFKREWVCEVPDLPRERLIKVRAWDKAATEPSDVQKNPDYTASIGMAKNDNGDFFIFGSNHPDSYDEPSNTYGRFRKKPGERDNIILKQAHFDGRDCEIIMPMDPGAAGKVEFQISSKKLMMESFIVRRDSVATQVSKLKKFEPFSAAAENGHIFLVKSSFDKTTLDHVYKELESFDGTRSSGQKHDDIVDCVATAFNFLVTRRSHRIITRNQINNDTIMKRIII